MIQITDSTQFFTIPLTSDPQSFNITLANIPYIFTVYWNNSQDGGWTMDIQDGNTNAYLIAGIPFITGADLLSGLEYLGINGILIVYTNGNSAAVPTFDNLGDASNLYFATNATDG